jgi:cytochrome c-type biogenesis protein CcmH
VILFWIAAGGLVIVALAALLRPLLWGAGASPDQGESAVAVFRRELANLDTEVAQERLAPDEAAMTRAEITRRMLAAADREAKDQSITGSNSRETSWRISAAVGIAGLLPTAALAVYAAVGTPAAVSPAGVAAEAEGGSGRHSRAELAAAAEQLKARLQREPDHVEGWVLLARTFVSLERFADARDAYGHAIALAPDEPQLHAELGELLVLSAGGNVTPAAEAEFAKAGDDPRARFYSAEAALQHGDPDTAKAELKALLASAPPEAPWRKIVEERLAEISPGQQPATGTRPTAPASAGPTAEDVAAVRSMSPEQRQAMIRGMVDRLAARLEQNPNDKDGWTRLAHAYDVLGETDKAEAARTRAAQASSSEK